MNSDAASSALLPEWRFDGLYDAPDSPQFTADITAAEQRAQAFADEWRGRVAARLKESGGGVLLSGAIAEYEKISDLAGRVMSYAALRHAQDNTDPSRARFFGDVQERISAIYSRLMFFTLEINALEDADLNDPALKHYAPWLRDLRIMKPYLLGDDLERLLNDKRVSGSAAWNRLFDETMTRLRFSINGESLPIEPTLHRLTDPDANIRRTAAGALVGTFREALPVFTRITNTLVKDKYTEDRWRGFDDPAHSRHLANCIEPEVVEALASAVHDAYPRLTHRYYALKARWMGADSLPFWDRNAPLPDAARDHIPWEDARAMVISAYAGFSPAMADIANRFFDEGWIDASPRPGKSPGAFSHPTVPSAHPFVLLNYQGRVRDVMTLAHELGHGVHQVLAGKQGALMASTPLTLAETASVFGEMLTFRSLLDGATDPLRRRALLAGKVEDMLNTVVRQIAFYDFEKRLHLARRDGELTADDIGKIWMETQSVSLGDAIRLEEGYENFWCYVPHFIHAPFYVYAYAFGDCLVNALYAVYQDADSGFADAYLNMLRAGGSKRHHELLAPFGLNAADPAFWSKGLDVIAGMIDELEKLPAKMPK